MVPHGELELFGREGAVARLAGMGREFLRLAALAPEY
jgi:hypothetical protein